MGKKKNKKQRDELPVEEPAEPTVAEDSDDGSTQEAADLLGIGDDDDFGD